MTAVSVDVMSPEALKAFIDGVAAKYGRIDILVNNAGTSISKHFGEIDDATWHLDLELKLMGAVRGCRAAIPYMQKQGGGRIVNITTIGELLSRTGDELMEAKNFGVTSLNEVREKLTIMGLKLRGD